MTRPELPSALVRAFPTLVGMLENGERPNTVSGLDIEYRHDNDMGEDYAFIACTLPADTRVFVETDGETYGELQGFRVYIPA